MAQYPKAIPLEEFEEPIWEQHKKENKKYYHMFLQYADLKASERTYVAAWRLFTEGSKREGQPISPYYRTIAGLWHWKERASARDFHIMTTQQSKWIERDQERRDQDYKLGSRLLEQAGRILEGLDEKPADGTLVEAKDVAVAGANLRERAVPSFQFAADQIRWLLNIMPADKAGEVLKAVQEIKQLQGSDVIEGDVRVIEE